MKSDFRRMKRFRFPTLLLAPRAHRANGLTGSRFTAIRLAPAALCGLLLTALLALASCGGAEGGDSGNSAASKDALWDRWRVANVEIGAKKCSVAFACYPDTANQGLRGSVEACQQFQRDTIKPTSLPGDFETCVLDSVPTLEGCAAALNSKEDKAVCKVMAERTLVFKYAEVPECSSLVAADVKCAVIVPAPKRGSQ